MGERLAEPLLEKAGEVEAERVAEAHLEEEGVAEGEREEELHLLTLTLWLGDLDWVEHMDTVVLREVEREAEALLDSVLPADPVLLTDAELEGQADTEEERL